jgi:hypothetical protein
MTKITQFFKAAKENVTKNVVNPMASVKENSNDVEYLERNYMHKSWYKLLHPEFAKPYFIKVYISSIINDS